jgi:hypothetical protein
VISQLHRQHRVTEFRKFLITIDKTVPADLGHPPGLRQLRYPQDTGDQGMAGQASAVSHAGDTVSVPSGSWQTNLG